MTNHDEHTNTDNLQQQHIFDRLPEQRPHDKTALGEEDLFMPLPSGVFERMESDTQTVGGPFIEPPEYQGSIGRTMFDTPSSEDNSLTVLLPRESLELVPTQALLRIHSIPDGRDYLGVVINGPFAEPDGLRGDAPIVVTTTVKPTSCATS